MVNTMATPTHKILIEKATGKIVPPVYTIDSERPEPPDCLWHIIQPGTWLWDHFCEDPPKDIGHIDIDNSYFDFESDQWNEVPSSSVPSFENAKFCRNELLKQSDRVVSKITDPAELAKWTTYRQQLRNMFVGIPEDFDWNMLVYPRSPDDIAELHRLAEAGDEEAQAIIQRDNL